MIDRLEPYPEYKESEVPWLGRIPAHWEVKRMKYVLRENDSLSNDGKEQLLRVSQYTGVSRRLRVDGSAEPDTRAESLVGYKRVQPGELVVNIMLAWNGSLGVSVYHGIVSPAYCVYRFGDGLHPWYFHHLLRSPVYKGRIKSISTGVVESRLRMYSDDLYRIESLLPPPKEQAAIVKFLDHTTKRLNRSIRAKQKVIALLNEQKQVIIHRAVTRGLDPDVPLKPSGVPWLGDIPAHWELFPLKSLCLIQSGVTLGKYYIGQDLTEYPYLRVANVQAGHLNLGVLKTLRLPAAEASRSLLEMGDVLMTEGGDPDKLGRGCVWEGEVSPCLHQNHIFAVRPDIKKLLPKYLSAVLGSDYAKNYFLATAKQTTNLASTNKTTIGRFRIPLPDLLEQIKILSGIEKDTLPVVQAIARNERKIALLQEYRARLIADVVKGKLDVREAAHQIPDEPGAHDLSRQEEEFSHEYDELDSGLTEREETDQMDSKMLE